jgi:hypothetical protein
MLGLWLVKLLNPILGILTSAVSGLTPPVANPSLWLDANVASSFTFSSGTKVSEWRDLSGNARHFAQSSATYQPELQSNIQNSKPSVYFNVDNLTNTSWDWSASAYTVFVVVQMTTPTFYNGVLARATTGSLQLGWDASDKYAISRIGQATTSSNLTGTSTTGNANVVTYKGTAVTTDTTVQIYKNGTAASSTVNVSISTNGTTNILGATRNSGSDGVLGYISEVLIYPSQLSNGDRTTVEDYLKTKWGTP